MHAAMQPTVELAHHRRTEIKDELSSAEMARDSGFGHLRRVRINHSTPMQV